MPTKCKKFIAASILLLILGVIALVAAAAIMNLSHVSYSADIKLSSH